MRPRALAQSGRGHSRDHAQPIVLRALLGQPEGSTVPVLQKLGVAIDRAAGSASSTLLEQRPKVQGGAQAAARRAPLSQRPGGRLQARPTALKDEYVSTEHLLLAIASSKDDRRRTRCCARAAPSARPC